MLLVAFHNTSDEDISDADVQELRNQIIKYTCKHHETLMHDCQQMIVKLVSQIFLKRIMQLKKIMRVSCHRHIWCLVQLLSNVKMVCYSQHWFLWWLRSLMCLSIHMLIKSHISTDPYQRNFYQMSYKHYALCTRILHSNTSQTTWGLFHTSARDFIYRSENDGNSKEIFYWQWLHF